MIQKSIIMQAHRMAYRLVAVLITHKLRFIHLVLMSNFSRMITIRQTLLGRALSGLLLPGCELEKSPLNGPTTGTLPAPEEEALMGLYGAYRGLTQLDVASTPILHVMDNITDV